MPDRRVVLVCAGAIAAGLGRALPARSAADTSSRKETGMGRVVGLGGVFLKVEDEKA